MADACPWQAKGFMMHLGKSLPGSLALSLLIAIIMLAACGPDQPLTAHGSSDATATNTNLDASLKDVLTDTNGQELLTDVAPSVCGDGKCQPSESCETCAGDCGVCAGKCGDGTCSAPAGEACGTCGIDCGKCPATCGNLVCDSGESPSSCAQDCKQSNCGDGACSFPNETCTSCPADCGKCGQGCGDATCAADLGENCLACSADCGPCGGSKCGDGVCQANETHATCSSDCPDAQPKCGDGVCAFAAKESCATCPGDCPCSNGCGNGVCEGNGVCDGDGVCTGNGETCLVCPLDCGVCPAICGDGSCDPGETCKACQADCGACLDTAGTSCLGHCGQDLPADHCQCAKYCEKNGNCCPDYLALCPEPPGCGNGKCDLGESITCPNDCPALAKDLLPCLATPSKHCLTTLTGCWLDKQCAGFLICTTKCTSAACVAQCVAPVTSANSLAFIADFKKCSGIDPPPFDAKLCFSPFGGLPTSICGDGACSPGEAAACQTDCNGASPVCGNGSCQAGEDWINCPLDCKPPLTAVDQCLLSNCASVFSTDCVNDPSKPQEQCALVRKCIEGGFNAIDCFNLSPGNNIVPDLVLCGKTAGCFDTATSETCTGACGQFTLGSHCECIPECVKLGNCCKDYVPKCGLSCANNGNCSAGAVCCSTIGGKICLAANQCP